MFKLVKIEITYEAEDGSIKTDVISGFTPEALEGRVPATQMYMMYQSLRRGGNHIYDFSGRAVDYLPTNDTIREIVVYSGDKDLRVVKNRLDDHRET